MPVTRMRAASDGAAPARRAAVITAPTATEARSPSRERSLAALDELGEGVLEERLDQRLLVGEPAVPRPRPTSARPAISSIVDRQPALGERSAAASRIR